MDYIIFNNLGKYINYKVLINDAQFIIKSLPIYNNVMRGPLYESAC